MISQLEALVDEDDVAEDGDAEANADPHQLQRIDVSLSPTPPS